MIRQGWKLTFLETGNPKIPMGYRYGYLHRERLVNKSKGYTQSQNHGAPGVPPVDRLTNLTFLSSGCFRLVFSREKSNPGFDFSDFSLCPTAASPRGESSHDHIVGLETQEGKP